jgi:hypothetical protein
MVQFAFILRTSLPPVRKTLDSPSNQRRRISRFCGGRAATSSGDISASICRNGFRPPAGLTGRRAGYTLPGDPVRRELVFYELGKFSQAISDYEEIYFSTSPYEKYTTFAKWLAHQAPDYYAESDADVGYASPDAVTLATVHQAKGMQWPAVFVPCLRNNRFPSRRWGGLSLMHVIPPAAIRDFERYRSTLEDETRLFYVAVTRAQKYLFPCPRRAVVLRIARHSQCDPGRRAGQPHPHPVRSI